MGQGRFFPVAVAALSLATASVAQGAPQTRVSDGTLSIEGSDDMGVSAFLRGYTSQVSVYGPPPGQRTLSRTFAYGPRLIWQGVAPVPGTGCQPQPEDSEGPAHVGCPDVARIDISLGQRDDFLSVVSSSAPVRVSGGGGDDGLVLYTSDDTGATVDGGPGNDSLRLERAGTVYGGPGDDYISVENTSSIGPGAVVDCGPGDDVVVDDYPYLGSDPPTINAATCGPVLRPVAKGTMAPPPGPDELRFPIARAPRRGRVTLESAFRPSEAGRGTIALKRARSVTSEGFPKAGTRWTACSKRRRFRMRAGRVMRTTLTLVPSVARRVARLRRPRSRLFSRKSMIPCSLHLSGVDDDGERFHRADFSLVLVNPR